MTPFILPVGLLTPSDHIVDTAGTAGTTTSGDAIGGNSGAFTFADDGFEKRDIDNAGGLAGDGGFSTSGLAEGGTGGDNGQGGNAYSGSTGHADGGNVNNGEIDIEEFGPIGNGGGFGSGSAAGAGVPGAAPAPPPPGPNAPRTWTCLFLLHILTATSYE